LAAQRPRFGYPSARRAAAPGEAGAQLQAGVSTLSLRRLPLKSLRQHLCLADCVPLNDHVLVVGSKLEQGAVVPPVAAWNNEEGSYR
jgi:hypothetical protein